MDVLAELPASEQERLARSEVKLLDNLDRLARRGAAVSKMAPRPLDEQSCAMTAA
jgi:hypothetical protein